MTIKQVCEKSGLSADTIRFYERIGLVSVTKGNYFKLYSEQTLEMLIAIKKLRAVGLSIAKIKELSSIEAESDTLSQVQFNSVIAIIDNARKRAENRAKEISQAQQLLERMKIKLTKVHNENC